jgi:uncharacterized protein
MDTVAPEAVEQVSEARASTRLETPATESPERIRGLGSFFVIGIAFGFVLTKTEVVSWFRIQEMFRFQSFHMYGVIGSAIVVAFISIRIIRRYKVKDRFGNPIVIPPKVWGSGTRYWAGGILFGLGWALTGACPGPIFALFGSGITVMAVVFLSAVAGSWVYGVLRPHLPH